MTLVFDQLVANLSIADNNCQISLTDERQVVYWLKNVSYNYRATLLVINKTYNHSLRKKDDILAIHNGTGWKKYELVAKKNIAVELKDANLKKKIDTIILNLSMSSEQVGLI